MKENSVLIGIVRWAGLLAVLLLGASLAQAEQKNHRETHVVTTDEKGIETELQRTVFYYEEKINETSFIPHELNTLPVKRGAALLQVRFDTIKQIEIKPGVNEESPIAIVTLTNGKSGEFLLPIAGSFKGISEFGEVQVPVADVRKALFR